MKLLLALMAACQLCTSAVLVVADIKGLSACQWATCKVGWLDEVH